MFTHTIDNETLQLVKAKNKTAAWLVSNCHTLSRRDHLVRKLKNFIDVDVYGACGEFSCLKGSKECNEMLNTTYKFYLSFENALCVDYVTEKLYNAVQNFVVPVVFNGANMTNFLPPMSYIDANDFETVEDLANHLKALSHNPEEYLKYFWWRKHYKIIRPEINLCEICVKLNERGFASKRQTYSSIKDWFDKDACIKPKIKF